MERSWSNDPVPPEDVAMTTIELSIIIPYSFVIIIETVPVREPDRNRYYILFYYLFECPLTYIK
jgi:hypothetical protein